MFLKFVEHVHKVDNLKHGIHKGVVVSNGDPEKLGRVKCRILGLIEESDFSKLPWVYPRLAESAPSGKSINVPEKGTEVAIVFPYGNIYHPEYVGYWVSEKNAPAKTNSDLFGENYPFTYGEIDSVSNWWRINKTKKFVQAQTAGKTKITLDNNGNVEISNPKNIKVENGGNLTFDVKGDSSINTSGKTTIKSGTEVAISSTAGEISITTPSSIKADGLNVNITGAAGVKVTSPNIQLGGDGAVNPCLSVLTPCFLLGVPHTPGSATTKVL
jgi:hypothetical protein